MTNIRHLWGIDKRTPEAKEKLEKYLSGEAGEFNTALFDSIATANESSLEKLSQVFPAEVNAYKRYKDMENEKANS